MKKKEIDLELGIVSEFEEFKKRMEWLHEFTRAIMTDFQADKLGNILDFMKFYREINLELMDKKIQNVAFLKMVEENLKKVKDGTVDTPTFTAKNTAGLG
jgi:translation initiation factor 2 alpha subunit (eIF-2alpha)